MTGALVLLVFAIASTAALLPPIRRRRAVISPSSWQRMRERFETQRLAAEAQVVTDVSAARSGGC